MFEIVFVGTLHCGFTDTEELKEIILDIDPDLLLVEISQEDIENKNISQYPDEMRYAYRLAEELGISCKGFDTKVSVSKKGIPSELTQEIIAEQGKIIKQYSWKEFNNSDLNQKLTSLSVEMIDFEKWNQRELEMNKNIETLTPRHGTVLILTGTAHLAFFERVFPNAKFPLRD